MTGLLWGLFVLFNARLCLGFLVCVFFLISDDWEDDYEVEGGREEGELVRRIYCSYLFVLVWVWIYHMIFDIIGIYVVGTVNKWGAESKDSSVWRSVVLEKFPNQLWSLYSFRFFEITFSFHSKLLFHWNCCRSRLLISFFSWFV